jgi:sugar/nucleoside kinase (ribokinase family)
LFPFLLSHAFRYVCFLFHLPLTPKPAIDFKYLTPKLRLEVSSLTPAQALAQTFHMVCSPTRCMTLVRDLHARRAALDSASPPPIIIWEPIPDLCTPTELANLRLAATHVDVISPNGEELAQFFATGADSGMAALSRAEMVASLLVQCGLSPRQVVVVRDGADGSRLYVGEKAVHFRAYHLDGDRVVDPTGGGNTYLGGLAMGMSAQVEPGADQTMEALDIELRDGSGISSTILAAVVHATISASFAIEQVGLPLLHAALQELWNGQSYANRYRAYLQREGAYLASQLQEQ